MSDSSVIILVADGVRPDALAAAIRAGAVPELAALADAGGSHTLATVFPSVTGVAYLPLLTGWHPATAGVPGLRWYDRQRRLPALLGHARSYVGTQLRSIDRDLDPRARTLFEETAPETLGSMAMITRGLPRQARLDRGWHFGAQAVLAHVSGDVGRWAALEARLADELVSRVRHERPRFVFASFTAGDKATHALGANDTGSLESLQRVDRVARQLREDAERDGRWPGMRLWIVSDHGHSAVASHLELADLLRDHGLRVRAHPWTLPLEAEAAVMVSGNSMAHVYVDLPYRQRRPWPDLRGAWEPRLSELWSHPAIDLVAAMKSRGVVEVWKGTANALVVVELGRYAYRALGGNPLGIEPFEGACETEAFERTREGPYPDAIVQLAALVLAERSGDLVVSAAPGWDLRRRYEPLEHRSSHGALHAAHMRVPLVGTNLPSHPLRRTVDLHAEAIRALGLRTSR